jgi:cob(I)alamin adenosyltransferase
MTIYTGRGDAGDTDLRDRSRVSKASPRIEAYGTVDELNAVVGRARPTGHDDLDSYLRSAQNHLHVAQADLADPDAGEETPRVRPDHHETVERWIDEVDADLDPLESFVLPGGGDAGADLHHARAVCRRAERRVVTLDAEEPVNEHVVTYLNRLSDALFVFARAANARAGVAEENPTY